VAVARQQIHDALAETGLVFDHEDAHVPSVPQPLGVGCKRRVRSGFTDV
jgi:hypothetical protein